jgi:hypothetical protein
LAHPVTDRQRIILIDTRGIALTPGKHLTWSDTNLPAADFTVQPRSTFPWKVLLKSYNRDRQHLVVKVTDYYPADADVFAGQQLKQPVRSLEFEPLDWYYLAGFLAAYKKAALQPFIADSQEIYLPDQSERHYRYQLRVHFKEMRFMPGAVCFTADLPALSEPVEIEVDNPHIVPEFEFIRSYFANALGRKKLEVRVDLTLCGDRIQHLSGHSRQIEAIDEKMVSTLKNTRVLGLRKPPKVIVVDKHLFNADEIFDQYYDEPDPNLFHQNARDIIRDLTAQGVVRNRKQLEYLAGRKQRSDQKILMTLAPHFGFMFIVSGQQENHFIWELINSHATYVWSFPRSRSFEFQLKKVEQIIGMIREQGRDQYKSDYQTDIASLPYRFNTVVHRHAGSGITDPFPGWKHQLEELLR